MRAVPQIQNSPERVKVSTLNASRYDVHLVEETIERDTIAKLNEIFGRNGCRTISSGVEA
jgi:hypothetical protein